MLSNLSGRNHTASSKIRVHGDSLPTEVMARSPQLTPCEQDTFEQSVLPSAAGAARPFVEAAQASLEDLQKQTEVVGLACISLVPGLFLTASLASTPLQAGVGLFALLGGLGVAAATSRVFQGRAQRATDQLEKVAQAICSESAAHQTHSADHIPDQKLSWRTYPQQRYYRFQGGVDLGVLTEKGTVSLITAEGSQRFPGHAFLTSGPRPDLLIVKEDQSVLRLRNSGKATVEREIHYPVSELFHDCPGHGDGPPDYQPAPKDSFGIKASWFDRLVS